MVQLFLTPTRVNSLLCCMMVEYRGIIGDVLYFVCAHVHYHQYRHRSAEVYLAPSHCLYSRAFKRDISGILTENCTWFHWNLEEISHGLWQVWWLNLMWCLEPACGKFLGLLVQTIYSTLSHVTHARKKHEGIETLTWLGSSTHAYLIHILD